MQAVDQRTGNPAIGTYTRVMALFGTIVAVVLLAVAIAYGAIMVGAALNSRATTPTSGAAVTTRAALDFRVGERAALGVSALQATRAANDFRSGERGDGNASAAQLNTDFRSGERGDTATN